MKCVSHALFPECKEKTDQSDACGLFEARASVISDTPTPAQQQERQEQSVLLSALNAFALSFPWRLQPQRDCLIHARRF